MSEPLPPPTGLVWVRQDIGGLSAGTSFSIRCCLKEECFGCKQDGERGPEISTQPSRIWGWGELFPLGHCGGNIQGFLKSWVNDKR